MAIVEPNLCAGGYKLEYGKPCAHCGAGPAEICPESFRRIVEENLWMRAALEQIRGMNAGMAVHVAAETLKQISGDRRARACK